MNPNQVHTNARYVTAMHMYSVVGKKCDISGLHANAKFNAVVNNIPLRCSKS